MLRVAGGVPSCLYIHLSLLTALVAAEVATDARPLPTEGESKILAALAQKSAADFAETPLTAVVDFLKQKHEIEIQLDSKALSDSGVGSDTPITTRLHDIRLRSLLRLMLGQLDLTYVVGDGYLLITSKTEAENRLRVKVYPVRDLVTPHEAFRAPQSADQRLSENYQSLIDVITSTVSPTMWEGNGPGDIDSYPITRSISFAQTEDVHEEVNELLSSLRRVRDQQVAAVKLLPPVEPPQPPANDEEQTIRIYRIIPLPANIPWPNLIGGFGMGGMGGGMGGGMFMLADDGTSNDVDKTAAPAPSSPAPAGPDPKSTPQPSTVAADTQRDEQLLNDWTKEIAQRLPELVAPGTWGPAAGSSVQALAGAIVVRQNREVQEKVADFLADLLPGRVVTSTMPCALQTRLPVPGPRLDWPHEAEPRAGENEAHILAALAKKCDIDFHEATLASAIETLAAEGAIQVWLDHKALSDAGVGTDTPVTRSMQDVTLRTAFRLILGELDLTYVIRNEVFIVTSKTEAENMLVTKVYPVYDLIAARPADSRPLARFGFHLVGVPQMNVPRSNGDSFQSLIGSITANIEPTNWDEVGGPGAIQPFGTSLALVISQTTEMHERIAEYLKALRETGAAQN